MSTSSPKAVILDADVNPKTKQNKKHVFKYPPLQRYRQGTYCQRYTSKCQFICVPFDDTYYTFPMIYGVNYALVEMTVENRTYPSELTLR